MQVFRCMSRISIKPPAVRCTDAPAVCLLVSADTLALCRERFET